MEAVKLKQFKSGIGIYSTWSALFNLVLHFKNGVGIIQPGPAFQEWGRHYLTWTKAMELVKLKQCKNEIGTMQPDLAEAAQTKVVGNDLA